MFKGELDKMNIKNNIEDNFYYNQYIHHEIFTIIDKNCKNENFGNITDFIIAANRYYDINNNSEKINIISKTIIVVKIFFQYLFDILKINFI